MCPIRKPCDIKRSPVRRMFIAVTVWTYVLLTPAFSAMGGSDFRCGGKIIDLGDTQTYIRDQCGEPSHIEGRSGFVSRTFRHRYPESHEELDHVVQDIRIEVWTDGAIRVPFTEIWTYNLGKTQFIRYLTFREGKLIRITTGDYGY